MREFSGNSRITEPKLLFSAQNSGAVSIHPLEGLLSFGPFSQNLGGHEFLETIRIAAIYPEGCYQIIRKLILELNNNHQPVERKNYLKQFPGFRPVFKKSLDLLDEQNCVSLPADLIKNVPLPHIVLSQEIVKAIRQMSKIILEFDVLYIYLPDSWSSGFQNLEEGFDLHDYLKAITASFRIPTQIIRENSAIKYKCRCSVAWRLSIATYVKSGGIPWRLSTYDEDTAVIGLSYALRMDAVTDKPQFLTCCSQVFDSDGTGLEFIAYQADEYSTQGENPFLSRYEMRRVMQRSLELYLSRHPGRTLKRIIVHKTTPFKADEIEGCFDAFPNTQIELLQIKQSTPWRAVKLDYPRHVSNFPVNRGTFLQIASNEILLWTQGLIQSDNWSFYKEAKGIPSPLHIVQFAGSDSWYEHCNIIMGLTKMNWNHDAIYDRLPVTLGYATTLASTLKSLPKLGNRPYEFKFFM